MSELASPEINELRQAFVGIEKAAKVPSITSLNIHRTEIIEATHGIRLCNFTEYALITPTARSVTRVESISYFPLYL